MPRLSRFAIVLFVIAALAGASSIALAASAAHALGSMVADGPRAVRLFDQAADFQIKHALALVLATLVAEWFGRGAARCAFRAAAVLLALGAVLFPTALYSSAFGGPVWWAPWGGTMAMIGWLAFGVGAILAFRAPPQC